MTFIKKLLFGAAAATLVVGTFAAVKFTPDPPEDRQWQMIRGTTNVGAAHASSEACWAAVRAEVEARKSRATYRCVKTERAVAEYVPDPVTPPPHHGGAGEHMPAINMALVPPANLGYNDRRVNTTGEMPRASDIGAFRTVCDFSHMSNDDPILYPGQQGRAHFHTFFGNTLADYRSTPESILTTGNSTCRGGILNRSSYWVPAMIDTRDGRPIRPRESNFYYKTGYLGVQPSQVVSFPPGFRMIAGNAASTGPQEFVRYSCGGINWQNSIPNCSSGNLEMEVRFPQCWNGRDLTSPNGRAHVAYANGRGCPADFPVALPEVSTIILYPITNGSGNDSSTWRLSSDNYMGGPGGYSGHADWFHGWDQDTMNTWVTRVLQQSRDGGSHILGDGRIIY